jgi:hypothetical protein
MRVKKMTSGAVTHDRGIGSRYDRGDDYYRRPRSDDRYASGGSSDRRYESDRSYAGSSSTSSRPSASLDYYEVSVLMALRSIRVARFFLT